MKRLLPLLCTTVLAASTLASDRLRDVQTELKSQGFYYGDVTGNESTELTAAIRRYQIRNGLEVTGTLTPQTLKSLGMPDAQAAAPATKPTPSSPSAERPAQTITPPPPVAPKPPVNLRKNETVQDNDRRFLNEEPRRRSSVSDPSVVRPPAPMDGEPTEPSDDYIDLFAGTPYATAPQPVQEQTVKRAQTLLASRGFYRDAIDGDPGPATEEAILSFQRISRLPLTGRLDLQTLAELRLLPGRGTGNPALRPFNSMSERSTTRRVYRGVWVE